MKAILGTQDFGGRLNLKLAQEVLETFIKYSPESTVVVDTSRLHDDSEKCLGLIKDSKQENVLLSTKASPWEGEDLSYNGVLKQFNTSLKNLQVSSVHTFYLHAPDCHHPVTESLRAVDQLYREGKIIEFGLCNYAAWQVAEICTLCKANSWITPTVYQGMYNCLTRMVETELIPCLKYFGIKFYAYNILCYGLLSGKYNFDDIQTQGEKDGKFFSELSYRLINAKRYWRKSNFIAIEKIQDALTESYGKNVVSLPEAALRWLCFHSQLDSQKGDGLLLGVSSPNQIRQNMAALNAGKLSDQVVEAFDQG